MDFSPNGLLSGSKRRIPEVECMTKNLSRRRVRISTDFRPELRHANNGTDEPFGNHRKLVQSVDELPLLLRDSSLSSTITHRKEITA